MNLEISNFKALSLKIYKQIEMKMDVKNLSDYERLLKTHSHQNTDAAHDLSHVKRVVKNALEIQSKEGGNKSVIEAASWFHDLVNYPKDHPDRALASRRSAEAARDILKNTSFSDEDLDRIAHAIEAHSFSADINPDTLEARIVQDADRLDSLGAIGIARTFSVCGNLNRTLFDPDDPFAMSRPLDDKAFGLDHFEIKLFRIAETLHTKTAQTIARRRINFMRQFMKQLEHEV